MLIEVTDKDDKKTTKIFNLNGETENHPQERIHSILEVEKVENQAPTVLTSLYHKATDEILILTSGKLENSL